MSENAITTKFVYEMVDDISPAIRFMDHDGKYRSFRRYLKRNLEGITDIKGEDVILTARFPRIEISSQYEAFIAGDFEDVGKMEQFGRRLRTHSRNWNDFSKKVKNTNFFKGIIKSVSQSISKWFGNMANHILRDTDGWEAFSLDGKPLFNGERFYFYDEIIQKLEERSSRWDNWSPDLPTGHDWRLIVNSHATS